mmetsp:Transcript_137218/g.256204  ORF Transcript_137218/g.256204 Transcript_137218/m.256204 type:complete len:501 (-) Transcript_137218:20-1522(-)
MPAFPERLSLRQKAFKKIAGAEDGRRRREDDAVQLRKQTREEALRKKRMINDQVQPVSAPSVQQCPMDCGVMPETLQMIMDLAQAIRSWSSCPQVQFLAVQQLRKLLNIASDPPIEQVISTGIVPHIVEFMKDMTKTGLQIEAGWVLNIITSGMPEQTRAVVDAGALPVFMQLLESPHEDVCEQAIWALGNIAGDSWKLRNLVIQSGGLDPILKSIRESKTASMMRNSTWVLSNLCRGRPHAPLEWVAPALPTLSQLINSTDEEVLADACWALACISDGEPERIDALIEAGACQRLVDLLDHASPMVQLPAVRAVGNIVLGDEAQTEAILLCEPLPLFLRLLTHQNKSIKKEVCRAISNIMAGNSDQVQHVIDNGLIPAVIHLLRTAEYDIKREAAWVMRNATAYQVPEQIKYFVQCDCIKPLVDLLSLPDVKGVGVALYALEKILMVGQSQQHQLSLSLNEIAALVEQAEGLRKIEALQDNPNGVISSMAMKILDEQFP